MILLVIAGYRYALLNKEFLFLPIGVFHSLQVIFEVVQVKSYSEQ